MQIGFILLLSIFLMLFFNSLLSAALFVLAVVLFGMVIGFLYSIDWKEQHKKTVSRLPSHKDLNVPPMSICNIQAGDLHFRARVFNLQGKGDAIILLHGFPQTSISWEPFFEAAKTLDYKIIAFDQRGYSPNARPKGIDAYTTQYLVNDLFAVADSIGIERFHLAGHDWGSAIGWAAVMSRPDRILSWSALSVPHPLAFFESLRSNKMQQKKSRYFVFFRMRWLPELIMIFGNLLFLRRWMYRWMPKNHQYEYLSVFSEFGALSAALNWYRAMGKSEKFSYKPIINLPVLFIWGNRDPAIAKASVELQDQYIQGPYKKIEMSAGHWLLERRTEEVIEAILMHINQASKDSNT